MPPKRSFRAMLKAIGYSQFNVKKRAHLIDYPIDMTLREIAFVAKSLNMDFDELMYCITEGMDKKKKTDWKSMYGIEKIKHGDTKERAAQRTVELQGARKQISTLRDVLIEKGIQDPTLQA
jgi:hypothetical protein